MTERFDVVDVQPVTLAVAEAFVRQADIPSRIVGMFDEVYAWLRESDVKQVGHNHAVYDRFSANGMRMRAGFPVSKRFVDGERIKCLQLAACRAAHVTLVGPYSGISDAHTRLNAWCMQRKHALKGMSWEVYGDWVEDQSKLVTDIFFGLV
jgi:effector-binding domain-containing protein